MDLYFRSSMDIFDPKFFFTFGSSRRLLVRIRSATDFAKVKEKSKKQEPVTTNHKLGFLSNNCQALIFKS